jgi:toxin ParE1/3/4
VTRVRLTRTARRDLDEIRRFTSERWGRAQWLRYVATLSDALLRIAREPLSGTKRDSLFEGLRSVSVEKHLIFYRPTEHARGQIVVVRIIHQSRNLDALSYANDLEP